MLSLILLTQEAFFAFLFGSSLMSCSVLLYYAKKFGPQWVILYPFRAIKKYFDAYYFIFNAPCMIQREYDAAQGRAFRVDGPDINYYLVSDKALIKEIDHAPRDVLSLQAAAKTLLQPEYSMHRFNWFEQRGKDGTPLVRTLRSLLRNDLPLILPKTRVINSEIIDRMLSTPGKQPHISKIARACVASMNARSFFGEEFANNQEFMAAAEDFIDKTILIAESARLFPGILGRGLASFLEIQFDAQHRMFNALVTVAQQRIDEQELRRLGQTDVPEHRDCMQWIMEQSSRLKPWTCELTKPWGADRIVHELMALWFGAVHAMAMATVFAVRDLAMNPEYAEPLRKEIASPAYQAWEATGNGMPLLDSFLKESARLNPLDNVSTRRKVLKPFELSNGLRVQDGDWLATPLDAMNRDGKNWFDPHAFHGFRHLSAEALATLDNGGQFLSPEPEKAAPLTDTRGWQTWGTGRMACPGRFYAAAGIKQIVSLILLKYDCEIEDRSWPRKYSWRTCNVPRSDMPIVLRPRAAADAA